MIDFILPKKKLRSHCDSLLLNLAHSFERAVSSDAPSFERRFESENVLSRRILPNTLYQSYTVRRCRLPEICIIMSLSLCHKFCLY